MNTDKDRLSKDAQSLSRPECEQLAVSLIESLADVEPLSKEATAYHEAGHAVISHYFRGPVTEVVLKRRGLDERWEGQVTSPIGSLPPAMCVFIFLAGPLAAIKFRATDKLAGNGAGSLDDLLRTVCFGPDDQMEQFVQCILASDDDNVVRATVSFLSPATGSPFPVQVDVGPFEVDASRARECVIRDLREKNELVNEEVLQKGLIAGAQKVCELLDEERVWLQVTVLARTLLDKRREETVLQIELSGEEMVAIIDGAE